jgi:hypothetical protein
LRLSPALQCLFDSSAVNIVRKMSSPKPTAPAAPGNPFELLFGISNSVHYAPNQRQFYYTMHMKVKTQWKEGLGNIRSQEFIRFASEVLPEIHRTIDTGTAVHFSLVHVGKYKLSSKLKLIFVIESVANFDPKQFEKIFKKIIKNDGKVGERLKASVDGLKVKKCELIEYDHLKKHGVNPCALCGE